MSAVDFAEERERRDLKSMMVARLSGESGWCGSGVDVVFRSCLGSFLGDDGAPFFAMKSLVAEPLLLLAYLFCDQAELSCRVAKMRREWRVWD